MVVAAVDRRVRRRAQLLDLRSSQVDLDKKTIRVGNSKTDAGAGRLVPLNARAATAIAFWAEIFPNRKPDYAVFPTERVGAGAEGSAATPLITPPGALRTPMEFLVGTGSAGGGFGTRVRASGSAQPLHHVQVRDVTQDRISVP